MAQATGATSMRGAYVEYSTDGTTWTNFSGWATDVQISGGTRATGEEYTFDGENPIVTIGKSAPMELTVKSIYTEGGSDIFSIVKTAYETPSNLYIRWAPKGNTTGNFRYATGAGNVLEPPYPTGQAQDGKPITFQFKIKFTGGITKSTVP